MNNKQKNHTWYLQTTTYRSIYKTQGIFTMANIIEYENSGKNKNRKTSRCL